MTRGTLNRSGASNTHRKHHFFGLVGTSVRTARERAGLSQQELSDKIGMAKATIHKVEGGDTCSLFVLALIAEELDCSLDSLVPAEATP